MSKYFDGYASFDYKKMSKEKLITELKEKVRYIGEIKRNNNKEIAKVQSARDKTIANLEAKLAESEENIKLLENDRVIICNTMDMYIEKVRNLKQQLAEKEKETAYLTKQVKKFNNEAQKYFEDAYCNDAIYQDKISFAIEQLEKAKEFFLKEERDEEMDTDYVITKENYEIAEFLLDQIKQLKEIK